jgi:hypothetical protein
MKPLPLLLLALLAALIAVPAANSRQQQGQTVVIDGSKNPERFPEWFVWEQAFESLSASPGPVPLHREIGVTETDLAVLRDTHGRSNN